jgi:hypothetical protein
VGIARVVVVSAAAAAPDATERSLRIDTPRPGGSGLGDFSKEQAVVDESFNGRVAYGPGQMADGTADYRTRLAIVRAEALEHWRRQLAEQSSELNSAADRIRIWERRHQIDLPRDPGHRLIKLIAADTGLNAEEVRAEQRLRAGTGSSVAAIEP